MNVEFELFLFVTTYTIQFCLLFICLFQITHLKIKQIYSLKYSYCKKIFLKIYLLEMREKKRFCSVQSYILKYVKPTLTNTISCPVYSLKLYLLLCHIYTLYKKYDMLISVYILYTKSSRKDCLHFILSLQAHKMS